MIIKQQKLADNNDTKALQVMLVDDDAARAVAVESSLRELGYEVLSVMPTSNALLQIEQHRPDVVLIDLQVPGRDILESLAVVNEHNPTAMVMFSENDDPDYIQQAFMAGVSSYQIEGLNPEKLRPVIEVALAQFRSVQALKTELKATQSQLADQKVIGRAKALLIKQKKITEDQAHKMLTRMAMEHNLKLGDVANTIISTLRSSDKK